MKIAILSLFIQKNIKVEASMRSPDDFTICGYKTMMKTDYDGIKEHVRQIIKYTYCTLMSKGKKSSLVYVVDEKEIYQIRNLSL